MASHVLNELSSIFPIHFIAYTTCSFFTSACSFFRFAEEYREKFEIKTPDVDKTVSQLSGGNQQKVLLSMWISRVPHILMIDEPTRGIDVGTKQSIHTLIRSFAKQGMGVIMVSSDMPELIGASDRVISLYEGKISGELQLNEISEQRIMAQTSGLEA